MLNLVKKLISLVLAPLKALFDFPVIPDGVADVVSVALGYFERAVEIVAYFCPLPLMYGLLSAVVVIEFIEYSYYLILWVFKKVPFIGVE